MRRLSHYFGNSRATLPAQRMGRTLDSPQDSPPSGGQKGTIMHGNQEAVWYWSAKYNGLAASGDDLGFSGDTYIAERIRGAYRIIGLDLVGNEITRWREKNLPRRKGLLDAYRPFSER